MTSDRIKEIQQATAYPDSVSVQQALLQVWNECEQEKNKSESRMYEIRFGQHLKAKIEVGSDSIKVLGAINGWGDSVNENETTIQYLKPKTEELKEGLKPCPNHPDVLISQCGICNGTFPKLEQPTSPSIEKIKVWMPTIWSAPNQVVNKYGNSVQGVESVEGYFLTEEEYKQLKANNSLEELEKWVKEHESFFKYELLEFIQELKTKQ